MKSSARRILCAGLAPVGQARARKCSEPASAAATSGELRASSPPGRQEAVGDHRLAFGDRAGLVEDHGGQLGGGFQRLAVADVDAAPAA
jgi:hypothetical protein